MVAGPRCCLMVVPIFLVKHVFDFSPSFNNRQAVSSGRHSHKALALLRQAVSSGRHSHKALALLWQAVSSGRHSHKALALLRQAVSFGRHSHKALALLFILSIHMTAQNKSNNIVAFSPQANYTDRGNSAAGDVQPTFAGRCKIISATNPHGR
jgi:hypothetical protein